MSNGKEQSNCSNLNERCQADSSTDEYLDLYAAEPEQDNPPQPILQLRKLTSDDIQFYLTPPKPLYHSTPKKRFSSRINKGIGPIRLKF